MSPDDVDAQRRFAEKYELNMPLLCDEGARLRGLLGTPDGSDPPKRITYVVKADGTVAEVIGVPKVPSEEHPQLALEVLRREA